MIALGFCRAIKGSEGLIIKGIMNASKGTLNN